MGVVSTCAFSFMSKYLHQSCGPKPMTRVDINDNNQSSNNNVVTFNGVPKSWEQFFKEFIPGENLLDWKRICNDFIQEETWEESKRIN
jgi:hypothetical protein